MFSSKKTFSLLFVFILISEIAFPQSNLQSSSLQTSLLSNDKKISLFVEKLPNKWKLILDKNILFVRSSEKIWLPLEFLQTDDRLKIWNTRTEFRDGKSILVVEINPGFKFRTEPIWSKSKMVDSIQYNNNVTLNWNAKNEKYPILKDVPTHMSDRYSLFLLAEYGLKAYMPTYLYTEMQLVKKTITEQFKLNY